MPEWSVSREVVGAGPSPRATKPDVENSILSLRVPPHICTPSNCAHSHTHTRAILSSLEGMRTGTWKGVERLDFPWCKGRINHKAWFIIVSGLDGKVSFIPVIPARTSSRVLRLRPAECRKPKNRLDGSVYKDTYILGISVWKESTKSCKSTSTQMPCYEHGPQLNKNGI